MVMKDAKVFWDKCAEGYAKGKIRYERSIRKSPVC